MSLSRCTQAQTAVAPYGVKLYKLINAISTLRGSVGGGADQGIVRSNLANIVPTSAPFLLLSASIICREALL